VCVCVYPGRNDYSLTGSGKVLFTIESKAGFPCCNSEALLLVRVDVFGDHTTGHTPPVEAHELALGILCYYRVHDVLAGRRVEERSKSRRMALHL